MGSLWLGTRAWSLVSGFAVSLGLASATPREVRAGQPWPSLEEAGVRIGGGEKDVALVITIERYADLPPIEGAEANGVAWVRWFEKVRGVRPDKIVHLINKQGTKGEMLAKARELAELADPKGRIWVIFIGHGAPAEDQSEGLFVGWAAQQSARELYGQSLRQSELVDALGGGRRTPIVMVADACFNGTSRSGDTIARGLQPVLLADRQEALPANVTVLSAGRADQFAGQLPGAARPAFSYLVLGALRGWGDDPSYGDGDGQVTVTEALEFTRAALRTTLTGRSQTPEAAGASSGAVVLASKAKERAPDLGAIRDALRKVDDDSAAGGRGARTTVDRLGGGAGETGGGMKLDFDLDSMTQVEAMSTARRRAEALDKDASASPTAKAEAWEAFAKVRVKGENPYADEAAANARSWRQVAALAGEMRENWKTIRAALQLSVMELGKKKAVVAEFLGAYAKLGPEPELVEAAKVKRALDGGEAFPLGGGAAVTSNASGSSPGLGPAGYVEIPAGIFVMGSPTSEEGRGNEEDQREVRITRRFWIKQTEVTQAEWQAVMGSNPSRFQSCGESCPVENVSWSDATEYLNKLSDKEGLERCYDTEGDSKGIGCRGYRLPTDPEWEYAARAGSTAARFGPVDQVAWHGGNSDGRPHPVGKKEPNAWGLHDVLGNVAEWVENWPDSRTGRIKYESVSNRCFRGGAWGFDAVGLRSASWGRMASFIGESFVGFRPVRSIP